MPPLWQRASRLAPAARVALTPEIGPHYTPQIRAEDRAGVADNPGVSVFDYSSVAQWQSIRLLTGGL